MNCLVAIVGPTGVGKTELAISLAQTFDGEIVNADSRQVYRYMDIGTAKPKPQELARIPHHLVDIISPDDDFSLAQYQELAKETIYQIQQRGRLPLLTGGTGQYVWAVLEGWKIPRVAPDLAFRRKLEDKANKMGKETVYRELADIDPMTAEKIGPNNIRRIIRALEVYHNKGEPAPQLQKKSPPEYNTLIVGLTAERKELYRRIDLRVDKMVEEGLIAEVKKLAGRGYNFNLPAMSGIGYRQIGLFLQGQLTLPAALERTKIESHRLARQQYNWFRLQDERIHWFDIQTEVKKRAKDLVKEFLEENQPD